MKNKKFLTVILEMLFRCCDTHVRSPGSGVGGLGGSIFLRDIQPVYLSACGSE